MRGSIAHVFYTLPAWTNTAYWTALLPSQNAEGLRRSSEQMLSAVGEEYHA